MTTVLYLAGSARSGSTLVTSILGQSDGVVDVGEFWKIWWSKVDGVERSCGCGAPLGSCEFWRSVEEAAPGVFDPEPEVLGALREIGWARRMPRLWWDLRRGSSKTGAFAAALEAAYGAIAEVSGATVIVDSSKIPGPGLLVSKMETVEERVLHLVRDPRAIAMSWARRKDDAAGAAHLEPRAAGPVARAWVMRELSIETLLRSAVPGDRYLRVRYEDFARAPERITGEILRFGGIEAASPAFVGPSTVRLEPTHSAAGNPARFIAEDRRISPDERWRSELDPRVAREVGVLTAPLRLAYGYR